MEVYTYLDGKTFFGHAQQIEYDEYEVIVTYYVLHNQEYPCRIIFHTVRRNNTFYAGEDINFFLM